MAAVSIAKTLTKVVIGGGAVYATVQQGVWTTNTADSSKVLETVRNSVAPTASEYISKIPSMREVNNSVVSLWNKGVTTTFHTVADAPKYGKQVVESTKNLISNK
ncbi:MICOS complex subunit MIC13-like [Littorina saxatilis]|uniref:MICOS complex subunit MIC13 n=1 Tax=Littorina saxatilis TaxID=31220 RepID=A0AAN9B4U1_9CAEN